MNSNDNTPSPQPNQSKKSNLWLRIMAVIFGLLGCAIVMTVYFLPFPKNIKQPTSAVDVSILFGKFDGTTYISNRGGFSCKLGAYLSPGSTLSDNETNAMKEGETDLGFVYVLDNMGNQMTVGYFLLPDESLNSLNNSDSRKKLNIYIADSLYKTHKPGDAQILLDEIVDQENVFRIIYYTEASHIRDQKAGKNLDFMHGGLVFVSSNHVYTIFAGESIAFGDTQPKDQKFEEIRKMVYDLYKSCSFEK